MRTQLGLTAIDVLIVVAAVAIAVLLLRINSRPKFAAIRLTCINHLKQTGGAFRIWADDHGDDFPWNVSTNGGGTRELAESPSVLPHFLVVSNELFSPKVLICPADSTRKAATAFDATFSPANISYFIGLQASESNPASILSGDRTLSTNAAARAGRLIVQNASRLKWAPPLHGWAGNIVFADGSAAVMSDSPLTNYFATNGSAPAHFVLP